MADLSTPVQYLKGVGPRIADLLAAKGLHTVEDLLYYLPFRYEDRLNPRGIAELREGEMASVIAEVRGSGLFRTKRMPIFQMTAAQGRASLTCIWFNGTYLKDRFRPGQAVALYGRVERSTFGRGGLQIIQPQFEILAEAENGDDPEAQAHWAIHAGPACAVRLSWETTDYTRYRQYAAELVALGPGVILCIAGAA